MLSGFGCPRSIEGVGGGPAALGEEGGDHPLSIPNGRGRYAARSQVWAAEAHLRRISSVHIMPVSNTHTELDLSSGFTRTLQDGRWGR